MYVLVCIIGNFMWSVRLQQVFNKFKEFKALIKNHTEKKIKTFQSDNGEEFTLNEFNELCKESRIKRELSTPYNP